MKYATLKVRGRDAIPLLNLHRSRYPATGKYPFLIGDAEDLERIAESAESDKRDPGEIVRVSLGITIADWTAKRRKEVEKYGFSPGKTLGKWPGEVLEKMSIGIHKDILTGKTLPEVYLGLAEIEQPWHLPAVLRYGRWNACSEPEVHCAFHREWQERYGAEITGMSGDVVESVVARPPAGRNEATALAWEQYWYCNDIVDQGCQSVANLAATLMNSPYWYFWWD